MTVSELITELQKFPEDKEIYITCTYDNGGGNCGGTNIQFFEDRNSVELYNDEC